MDDWRTYPILRIRYFEGRVVGSLTPNELKGLVPWVQMVQQRWETVDDGIRILYAAIQEAMKEAGVAERSNPAVATQSLQMPLTALAQRETPAASLSPPPPAPIGTPKRAGSDVQTDQPEEVSSPSKEEQQHDERLNCSEQSRLAELERRIEEGLATFVEIGSALSEIRDNRLYRQTHPTFEAYCQRKWAMAARRARQLIGAAEVVSNLKDESVTVVTMPTHEKHVVIGTRVPIPTHEKHVRPLVGLGAEEQRSVWQRAVEASQGTPSEQQVRKIRDAMFPECKPKPKKLKRKVEPKHETDSAESKAPLEGSQDAPQEPGEVESKATRRDCVRALFTFVEVLANTPYACVEYVDRSFRYWCGRAHQIVEELIEKYCPRVNYPSATKKLLKGLPLSLLYGKATS